MGWFTRRRGATTEFESTKPQPPNASHAGPAPDFSPANSPELAWMAGYLRYLDDRNVDIQDAEMIAARYEQVLPHGRARQNTSGRIRTCSSAHSAPHQASISCAGTDALGRGGGCARYRTRGAGSRRRSARLSGERRRHTVGGPGIRRIRPGDLRRDRRLRAAPPGLTRPGRASAAPAPLREKAALGRFPMFTCGPRAVRVP